MLVLQILYLKYNIHYLTVTDKSSITFFLSLPYITLMELNEMNLYYSTECFECNGNFIVCMFLIGLMTVLTKADE